MFVQLLKNVGAGAAAGVAVVTVLPLAAVGMYGGPIGQDKKWVSLS